MARMSAQGEPACCLPLRDLVGWCEDLPYLRLMIMIASVEPQGFRGKFTKPNALIRDNHGDQG